MFFVCGKNIACGIILIEGTRCWLKSDNFSLTTFLKERLPMLTSEDYSCLNCGKGGFESVAEMRDHEENDCHYSEEVIKDIQVITFSKEV